MACYSYCACFATGAVALSLSGEPEQPVSQSAAEPPGEEPAELGQGEDSEATAAGQEFDVVQQLRLRFASCSIPHPEKVQTPAIFIPAD